MVAERENSMSQRIWKYRLHGAGLPTPISMPKGARIVHFAKQLRIPCLWALVLPDPQVFETRTFIWCGTGDEVRDDANWVGTCEELLSQRIMIDGPLHERSFIWHLFEVPTEGAVLLHKPMGTRDEVLACQCREWYGKHMKIESYCPVHGHLVAAGSRSTPA